MKAVLSILVIALARSAFAPPVETGMPPPMLKAAKDIEDATSNMGGTQRRFGGDDTGASCISPCVTAWGASVQRIASSGQQVGPGEYNPEIINSVCQSYDTMSECLNGCPNGEVKTLIKRMTGMFEKLCHSSIKDNIQCLKEVSVETNSTCSNQCGQYKRKMEEYQRNPPRTTDALEDVSKQTCLGMKCAANCPKQQVISKCGQNVQDDIEALTEKGMDTIKVVLEVKGLGQYVSSECDGM